MLVEIRKGERFANIFCIIFLRTDFQRNQKIEILEFESESAANNILARDDCSPFFARCATNLHDADRQQRLSREVMAAGRHPVAASVTMMREREAVVEGSVLFFSLSLVHVTTRFSLSLSLPLFVSLCLSLSD